MSLLVTFTGIIVACSAAIKNGAGLLAVRFFLGIAETGLFPGKDAFIGHADQLCSK